ncbi:MAG TPA: hypothetical protein VH331_12295 [Allosphingosinicella sp.]|jgi:hypothetical protein|nr:hypothetical protein [Allosphingosinicella sp.]
MLGQTRLGRGIGLASLAAGPIFLTANAAAWMYLQIPKPIAIGPSDLLLFVGLCIPAAVFGCILSILPNLIGSGLMVAMGDALPAARSPEVWIVAGGLAGLGIAAAMSFAQSPSSGFALVATSAICARICRRSVAWA